MITADKRWPTMGIKCKSLWTNALLFWLYLSKTIKRCTKMTKVKLSQSSNPPIPIPVTNWISVDDMAVSRKNRNSWNLEMQGEREKQTRRYARLRGLSLKIQPFPNPIIPSQKTLFDFKKSPNICLLKDIVLFPWFLNLF